MAFQDLGEGPVERADIFPRPEVADARTLSDPEVGEVHADFSLILRLCAKRFVRKDEELNCTAAVLAVVCEHAARGDGIVAFWAVVDDDGDGVGADAVDAASVGGLADAGFAPALRGALPFELGEILGACGAGEDRVQPCDMVVAR